MGNMGVTIKRFLGNKNTVTIIGVLAGIVVLYFGYNWRVNQQVQPVSIPYAKQQINGNTPITNEMIGSVKVAKSMIDTTPNLIIRANEVIGKYVRYDTTIAEGSLFYKTSLMVEEETPDALLKDIPPGYTVYSLDVSLHSTYGNSILPGNYIDLYIKYVNEDQIVKFGKFIESIQVLAVKDSQGQHVFSSSSTGTPSELLFAVPDEMFQLLRKADYITTNNIEVTPVPRNKEYSENPGATAITSEEIKYFINAKASNAEQNQNKQIETTPTQ